MAESLRRGAAALLLLFMRRVLATEAAVLAELEPLGRLLLVFRRAVVATLALSARQLNDVSHAVPGQFPVSSYQFKV